MSRPHRKAGSGLPADPEFGHWLQICIDARDLPGSGHAALSDRMHTFLAQPQFQGRFDGCDFHGALLARTRRLGSIGNRHCRCRSCRSAMRRWQSTRCPAMACFGPCPRRWPRFQRPHSLGRSRGGTGSRLPVLPRPGGQYLLAPGPHWPRFLPPGTGPRRIPVLGRPFGLAPTPPPRQPVRPCRSPRVSYGAARCRRRQSSDGTRGADHTAGSRWRCLRQRHPGA